MDQHSTEPAGHTGDFAETQWRSLRRAAFLTVGVGLAHAVLFLLSYWLLFSVPGAEASEAAVDEFYASTFQRRVSLAGLYLMPFAGIAFLWFIVALRMWISGHRRPENVLLSNIQLVSGILYIALFFAAAAAAATASASLEFAGGQVESAAARQLPQYGKALLFVFAMRMAAMFVFTTSNIGRGAGILPRWFTLSGFVVGLFLLLSASFNQALVLVFPLWVLVLCTLLLTRAWRIPADAVRAAPGGGGAVGT